jgi:hypothetical protein
MPIILFVSGIVITGEIAYHYYIEKIEWNKTNEIDYLHFKT